MRKELLNKAQKIKLIILDADGVLTEGRIVYGTSRGTEMELMSFHVHDGFGIVRAIGLGMPIVIISGRRSRILERRAKELGIREMYQGSKNKLHPYESVKKRHGLRDEEIAYMGDDIPDLVLLKLVGLSAAAGSAVPEVKRAVDYVSSLNGGEGAVREFIDLILRAQKKIKIASGFNSNERSQLGRKNHERQTRH